MNQQDEPPLIPNTINTKLLGGGAVATLIAVLGFLGSSVVDLSRELQTLVDANINYRVILNQRIDRQDEMIEEMEDKLDELYVNFVRQEVKAAASRRDMHP